MSVSDDEDSRTPPSPTSLASHFMTQARHFTNQVAKSSTGGTATLHSREPHAASSGNDLGSIFMTKARQLTGQRFDVSPFSPVSSPERSTFKLGQGDETGNDGIVLLLHTILMPISFICSLGMLSGCLTIDWLGSFCLVKSRGFVYLVALGLVSMMLCCMMVKSVKLVDRIEMRKTDCFGKTRLVPHIPSSSRAGKRYCYIRHELATMCFLCIFRLIHQALYTNSSTPALPSCHPTVKISCLRCVEANVQQPRKMVLCMTKSHHSLFHFRLEVLYCIIAHWCTCRQVIR